MGGGGGGGGREVKCDTGTELSFHSKFHKKIFSLLERCSGFTSPTGRCLDCWKALAPARAPRIH